MVDFAVHAAPLIAADIKVAFASVDSVAETAALTEGLRVGFPVFAELDAAAVAESTGASMQSGDRTFLHATGFLINPEGKVATTVYSSGPIGRITPTEAIRVVMFVRGQQ